MDLEFSTIADAFDNRVLQLIIFPTERCNLRCLYCYEDFAIGRMKRHVVAGIKSLIWKRAPDLARLYIGWFGGEPLLGLPVIRELSQEIRKCVAANSQIKYEASISTNAVFLTKNRLEELVNLGVRKFQVSLDGTREMHDQTRKTANGKSTFDSIWKNLLEAKKSRSECEINLRINLTRANYVSVPKLLTEIRQSFSDDMRFKVYFKAVEPLGGPNDARLELLECSNSKEQIKCLEARLCDTMLARAEGSCPAICYAAKANSFVVRADGHLGKCTVALNQQENCVGTLLSLIHI